MCLAAAAANRSALRASGCAAALANHRAARVTACRVVVVASSSSSSNSSMAAAGGPWRSNLLRDPTDYRQLALAAKRVAVLGIKAEDKASQPAHFVPAYLQTAGVEVVPVPVFYPDATHILSQQVYRRVQDVPGHIDIVDVFRKPSDLHAHLDDILAAKPAAVWLQSGITDAAFEEALARAGIKVVSDACLKVEHQQAAMVSKM